MRKYAAALLLVVLVVGAGCSNPLGPSPITEEQLTKQADEVDYAWSNETDASIDVGGGEYRSTYRVSNATLENASQMEVYTRNAFAMEDPLPIETLKFRYENGTVITVAEGPGHESFSVTQDRDRATIHFPADRGHVAFVVPNSGKSVGMPVYLAHTRDEGPSYEAVLPHDTDASIPLLSSVKPGGYTTETGPDGRVHVTWESVTVDHVSVRYYLDRDVLIFGSIAGVLTLVAIVGAVYYLRQIRALERRREEVGLDIDISDDDRDDPPPGMG